MPFTEIEEKRQTDNLHCVDICYRKNMSNKHTKHLFLYFLPRSMSIIWILPKERT